MKRKHVTAIVPAAGRSERFGGPKLVALVDGIPLVQRTLHCLLDAKVDRVLLVLSAGSAVEAAGPGTIAALADPAVDTVVNPNPDRGMFSSVQIGLAETKDDVILVLPADMPFVRSSTVSTVITAVAEHDVIVSPRFEGTRGHPIAFPGRLRQVVLDADPTSHLSDVLEPHKGDRLQLDLDDPGVLRDVDHAADLD